MTNLDVEEYKSHNFENEIMLLGSSVNDLCPDNLGLGTLLEKSIDWEYLFINARKHGVLPVLAHKLLAEHTVKIPSPRLNQLRQFVQSNSFNNLLLVNELSSVLKLFAKSKIAAIPFKGIILAIVAYQDFSLREISDLDILVSQKDFDRAKDLLIQQGFAVKINVPWECHLVNDRGTNIDLHCAIAPNHVIHPFHPDEIWQNVEKTHLGELEINTFTPEFLLIVLSLNGAKGGWQSLSRVCDVAQLLRSKPNLDWSKLFELASKWGFTRFVMISCLLANRLLSTQLKSFVWDKIKADKKIAVIADEIADNLFSDVFIKRNEVESTMFCLQLRERWQDKIGCLLQLANHSGWNSPTKTDREYLTLPQNLFWIYYFIRPLRVFQKYWLQSH